MYFVHCNIDELYLFLRCYLVQIESMCASWHKSQFESNIGEPDFLASQLQTRKVIYNKYVISITILLQDIYSGYKSSHWK